jgi:hypothetical protein
MKSVFMVHLPCLEYGERVAVRAGEWLARVFRRDCTQAYNPAGELWEREHRTREQSRNSSHDNDNSQRTGSVPTEGI